MCCWVTETIEFTLMFIVFTCVQGPVGTERSQAVGLLLLASLRHDASQTRKYAGMGCGAALGGGHRHRER
jgi:hypothetical protein